MFVNYKIHLHCIVRLAVGNVIHNNSMSHKNETEGLYNVFHDCMHVYNKKSLLQLNTCNVACTT